MEVKITDYVHIYMDEGGGITAEYCIPASEAQYYIEKFEANGSTFEGAAECPGEGCHIHNDPGEPFLDSLDGSGWMVALPPLSTPARPDPSAFPAMPMSA